MPESSPQAALDERKQATILFADVRGSLEIAERVGDERLREIMDSLFTKLAAAVTKYEGTVDKFTGDGIMAIFGAPVSLEDHALHACLAAVEMRDVAKAIAGDLEQTDDVALELRIGLNSGEIVSGEIGDDASHEYTAVGQTVGIAQRIESLAAPGEIWINETTSQLVGAAATVEHLGEREVKGLSQPLRPKRLLSVRGERGRVRHQRSGRAGLIGRRRELDELKAVAGSTAVGEGALIGIVGSPGVGKSRLAQEFAAHCERLGVPVYRANCQSHTREVARYALLRLLRDTFGIESDEPSEISRAKVASRLIELDPAFDDELPLVFDFLGIPDPERTVPQMDPSARHRRLLALVGQLARSSERPVVYLVEDMHWCDAESEVFFNAMADSTRGTSTRFVTTSRPEFDGEMLRRSNYRQIPLEPLSDGEMKELVAEMVGAEASLDELSEMVAERCAGIPLFAEEIIFDLVQSRALVGSPGSYVLNDQVASVATPSTVQAVLGARIDRLDHSTKAVLTTASSIGDEFRFDVLARASGRPGDVVDSALSELINHEFIVETELFPVAVYKFRHPLTREVAYNSQLAGRRSAVHRAIAGALESIYEDRLNETAALIATHYEAADDPLSAAHWLARDAAVAVLNDPASAFAGWQRVSNLSKASIDAGKGGEDIYLGALTMVLAQAYRFGMHGVDMTPVFDEARALAEKGGDPTILARLLSVYGLWLGMGEGNVNEWWRIGSEARKLTAELDVPLVRLATLTSATYCGYVNGKYEETIEITDELLELTRDDPRFGAAMVGVTPGSWARMIRAPALTELGRCEEARASIDRAVEIAEEFGGTTVAWALLFKVLCALRGATPVTHETIAAGDHSVALAEEIGDVFTLPATLACRVGALVRIGAAELALEDADRALQVIEDTGSGVQTLPTLNHFRMEALAACGEWDAAIASGESSIESALALGSKYLAPATHCGLAELRLRRNEFGDLQKAERLIVQAEKLQPHLGSKMDAIELHRVRSELHGVIGATEEAARERAAGVALARECDAQGQLARFGEQVEAS